MLNCKQLAQDLQSFKETFNVLKNQLAEFEDINSSSDVSRAEKIAKLKELYQIRKKLQEIYPPLEIMKVWAEKYLTTHKTSRRIAITQEQALTGKYLYYPDDIDCRNVDSAEGLKFPKIIGGTLDLSSLPSAKNLELPGIIGGSLYLRNLLSAEYLDLPDVIDGSLILSGLVSAEHLRLPNTVGGDLNLYYLNLAENLKLPENIGGSLYLRSLTSAEHLNLPDAIGGDLYLNSLTSVRELKLPNSIGGDFILISLASNKHLKLPNTISGDLYLNSAENLDLTHLKIDGLIYLKSLPQEEFEKLQEQYPNLIFKII